MERILLEVDDSVAKRWRLSSQKMKAEMSEKISSSLGNILKAKSDEDFLTYLDELGAKMEQRGMTQEILDEILKDE